MEDKVFEGVIRNGIDEGGLTVGGMGIVVEGGVGEGELAKGKICSLNVTCLLKNILSVERLYSRYPFCCCGYPRRTDGIDLGANLSGRC